MNQMRFENKIVLVTGGTSGIGRATAVAFAGEGAKVIVAARRDNLGDEVVKEIKNKGGEAVFIKTDVRVPADIDNLFDKLLNSYGRLDCAFNNAGVSTLDMPRAANIPIEEWDDIMNTNLRGVWLIMKHEIRQMLKQGGGVIVNTASILGLTAEYSLASYCASKHGIIGLTKAVALEYADKNIRINCVCPGPIRTEMLEMPLAKYPQFLDAVVGKTPMRRIADPTEVSGAVLWLCSEGASFMVGKELVVAGGQGVVC